MGYYCYDCWAMDALCPFAHGFRYLTAFILNRRLIFRRECDLGKCPGPRAAAAIAVVYVMFGPTLTRAFWVTWRLAIGVSVAGAA